MQWKIEFEIKARQVLEKLDKSIKKQIENYLDQLIKLDDPRKRGKGLTSNRSGQWRYRVGDYRIICEIRDDVFVVLVVEISFLQLNAGAVFENAIVHAVQAGEQVGILVIHAEFCTQARPRRCKIVRMLRLDGVIRIHEPVKLKRGILGEGGRRRHPNH